MPEPFIVAYFGLPLAACALKSDGHRLSLIVLSPVRSPGRRRLLRGKDPTRTLDALDAADSLEPRVEERLSEEPPDLIVSWFWTRRIPERWLKAARLGGIGAHPSLLPRHRGPNPYFWTIDSGDTETGVTIHRLAASYDTGSILLRSTVPVAQHNAWQLARALDRPSLRLLRQAVQQVANNSPFSEISQDEARATWAPEPEAELLRVNWAWTTERVLRRSRALSPVPGLGLEIGGFCFFATRIESHSARLPMLMPGEALLSDPPERVLIRTGDGAIAIERAVAGRQTELPEGSELSASGLAAILSGRLGRLGQTRA